MNPARSLKATRTNVAAPPDSPIVVVPSAYDSVTIRKRTPTTARTAGVSPSACRATMPSAK
jgi:hypothetical protein